jgi:hypothetical protein
MSLFLWATIFKNHNEPPKVSQLAKIAQSGHTELSKESE